jgi:hypothetical protein
MAGFKIKLPVAVSDITMKKLYADEIMSAGSLFLLDVSHSLGYSGTEFTNSGTVKNVAWEVAKSIIGGTADEASLAGNVITNNITAQSAILEYTQKKGLNVIISKANTLNPLGWRMDLPLIIRQYLLSTWASNKIYVSMWGNVTRLASTTTSGFALIANSSTSTSNYKILFEVSNTSPSAAGSTFLGQRFQPTTANSLGAFFRNSAVSGSVGTSPVLSSTTGVNAMSTLIKVGPAVAYGSFEAGKSSSMVIYRFYVEDLTVSGRTYAEVDALDKAMYDAAFAVGGKFYGDTFTDPSVLL